MKENKLRLFGIIVVIVPLLIALAGCGGGGSKSVLKTIEIAPTTASVQLNESCEFVAVGKDQNGKPMSITPTWTVTGDIGVVAPTTGDTTTFTANSAGSGTVVASVGDVSASANVTVSEEPPVLTSIEITPPSITVVNGENQEFTVVGKDQYGGEIAYTGTPTWEVVGNIGMVSPTEGNSTTFTASTSGNGTITASLDSLSGVAQVTVAEQPPVLTRLELSPSANITLTVGGQQALTATGYDQYDQQIASNPTWSVSDGLGTFSSSSGASTTFTASSAGTGQITTTDGNVTKSVNVTVNEAPRLVEITVSPSSATLQEGETQTFSANGRDQFGNVIATNLTWSVTGGIGTVTQGYSTVFSATSAGSGTVVATQGAVSGSANVTVIATTLRVPQDHSTIQAAIDASVDGGTIIVAEGTYNECIRVENKSLTIKSTNPNDSLVAASTIINGGNNGSTVLINGGSMHTVTIEGFTITGGSGSDLISGAVYKGGGVYAYIATTILRKNIISNNTAHNGGGGVYGYMCNMTLEGNMIKDNSSYLEGGGIHLYAGVGNTMNVVLTNNFVQNNASTDRSCGGIYTWNVNGSWTGNTIDSNSAHTYAGGICLNYSSPSIINNQITNNTAIDGSGGILVGSNSFPVIQNNTISNNQATSINAVGGGITISSLDLVLTGNTIDNNSAGRGGGIYTYGDFTLSDNVISNNSANSGGGGVFVHEGKTLTASGNSFEDNQNYAILLYGGATFDDQGGNAFSGNTPDDIMDDII